MSKGTNGSKNLYVKYINKNKFKPDQEACGECSRGRGLHYPGGIPHDFVPTRKKVTEGK